MLHRGEHLSEARFARHLLATASVSAILFLVTPATAANAAPSDNGPASLVDEIVVTAQKRAQRLEEVPIAITALDGQALQAGGITKVSDLPQMVPGLRLDRSGNFAQATIRGVGSSVAGPGLSTNVATYVDGFYVPNSLTSDIRLLSVSNVQVLKGPQGTLFGRNATGGAILVTTLDPSFDTEVRGNVSYARFNHLSAGAYGSTGLTDGIAMNISTFYDRNDGFVRNVITGEEVGDSERYAVRAKLLAEVGEVGRLILGYSHDWANDAGSLERNAYRGMSAAAGLPGGIAPTDRREVANNYASRSRLNGDAVNLTGDFTLGEIDIKSYTQYRDERTRITNDNDSSSLSIIHSNFDTTDKTFTQELNISGGQNSAFQWLVGGYYFWNKVLYPAVNVSFNGGPFVKTQGSVNTAEAYAGFADGTVQLADRIYVTGGLRYNWERARLHLDLPTDGIHDGTETWSSVTPRAVIRYEIADRSSIYASYSKGFKSGQLPAGGNRVLPVDPEKIDAFEIGYKMAGRGLRLDLAAYYYDYKDLQVTAFLSPGSIVRNAASAEIYGLEAQIAYDVTSQLNLGVRGAYTHASYQDFPEAVRYVQNAAGFFSVENVDAGGFTMQRAPRFTGSIDATYHIPLGQGDLTLNGNLYYSSKVYFDPVEQFSQDAYALLNLRATWAPDEQWEISLFGNNVTDAKYINQILPGAGAIQQGFGEPATVGVSVSFRL